MTVQEVATHLIRLWDIHQPLSIKEENKSREIRRMFFEFISAYSQNDLPYIGDAIREDVLNSRRKSKERSLHLIQLLFYLAELTNHELLLAISLHTEAMIFTMDEKEYARALPLYEEAAKIYKKHHDSLRIALMNVTKVWALGSIGDYQAAFAIGEEAEKALMKTGRKRDLANLYNNLAGIYVVRLRQYENAINLLNKAQESYRTLGESGQIPMLASQFNEAMLLRHLGRFQESIQLNEGAIEKAQKWGLVISAARGQQTLGTTFFIVGEFNKAIQLMEDARASYLQDNREHDAILVDLSLSTGLLNLGRFQHTIKISQRIIEFCKHIGAHGDAMRATYNMGLAYLGLNDLKYAFSTLQIAAEGFREIKNLVSSWEAQVGLATVHYRKKNWEMCLSIAKSCYEFFDKNQLATQKVRAALIMGKAALALGRMELVSDMTEKLFSLSQKVGVPTFTYQIYHFLGQSARQSNRITIAVEFYNQAIELVESLQGQVITELRADFLLNKQAVYEELAALHIRRGNYELALEVAERAKSRALLSLLSQRFLPRISVKNPADQPIAERLVELRKQRDMLYLSWQAGEYNQMEAQQDVFQQIRGLEEKITDTWHQLMVRDANYNRDRGLWQIFVDDAQKYLDGKTAVLEYFSYQGQLLVFLITQQGIQAQWLDISIDEVKNLHQFFWMNLNAVERTGRGQAFLPNAQSLLRQAYDQLFAPIASACNRFETLVIVPHGSLHYFPLHALFDGERYLIQKFKISYLPSSSFMGIYKNISITSSDAFVLGHSLEGKLPYAISEAKEVSQHLNTNPFLETDACKRAVITHAAHARIIHLATHAFFHHENPLFSGVALAENEWLTTLDIFNLTLETSLVTISACETGRSVIGGGDELLGIMRALLAAGAASAVLSLWAVNDQSTEILMRSFYSELINNNQRKDSSLRAAQLALLTHENTLYHHPFFWAPFFLVGANDRL